MTGARVTGDASKGCVWIGEGEWRTMALWYPGYWARFNPVRIYDAYGHLVWSELDPPREIGGGGVKAFIDRIPEQCRVDGHDAAWWVVPLSEV